MNGDERRSGCGGSRAVEKSVKAGLKSVKGLSSPEPARKDVLSNETERQEVRHGARARS